MLIPFIFSWTLLLSSVQAVEPRTITSTLTSTITATATPASSTPTNPSTSLTTDPEFRSSILNSTNFYRAQHNATALTWNETLAAYATTYAQKCLWKHSGGPSGENLAESFPNTTAAISAWANERASYDFARPTGFSEATGHFTALVWKASRSLGCGRFQCDNNDTDGARGWLLVCEYWPPGNVEGEFKTEVQRQTKGRKNVLGGVNAGGKVRVGWGLMAGAMVVAAAAVTRWVG